jgi:hypothetical protein
MDLAELYDRIKARDDVAGRPATDPQVVLVETMVERSGRLPQRLLTDTTAMTQDDIVKLTEVIPA